MIKNYIFGNISVSMALQANYHLPGSGLGAIPEGYNKTICSNNKQYDVNITIVYGK